MKECRCLLPALAVLFLVAGILAKPSIYVYELPAEITDTLKGTCQRLPLTYPSSVPSWEFGEGGPPYTLITTRQLHLEEILLHKFGHYSRRTHDPQEADFFVIPYMWCHRIRCDLGYNMRHGEAQTLGRKLQTQQLEDAVMQHVIHDLPHFNNSLFLSEPNHVVILGCVESVFYSSSLRSRSTLLDRYFQLFKDHLLVYSIEHSKIAKSLPYPTFFRFEKDTSPARVRTALRNAPRPLLVYFAGQLPKAVRPMLLSDGSPNCLRQQIGDQLLSHDNSTGILTRLDIVYSVQDGEKMYKGMLQSEFCLQPAGDTYSRRGLYDSIMLGCIPVVFEKKVLENLPWIDSYFMGLENALYYIPMEEVCTKKIDIIKHLASISQSAKMRMREKGLQFVQKLQYSFDQEEGTDAFSYILRDLSTIAMRKHQVLPLVSGVDPEQTSSSE